MPIYVVGVNRGDRRVFLYRVRCKIELVDAVRRPIAESVSLFDGNYKIAVRVLRRGDFRAGYDVFQHALCENEIAVRIESDGVGRLFVIGLIVGIGIVCVIASNQNRAKKHGNQEYTNRRKCFFHNRPYMRVGAHVVSMNNMLFYIIHTIFRFFNLILPIRAY